MSLLWYDTLLGKGNLGKSCKYPDMKYHIIIQFIWNDQWPKKRVRIVLRSSVSPEIVSKFFHVWLPQMLMLFLYRSFPWETPRRIKACWKPSMEHFCDICIWTSFPRFINFHFTLAFIISPGHLFLHHWHCLLHSFQDIFCITVCCR